jgi:hypothetical protein
MSDYIVGGRYSFLYGENIWNVAWETLFEYRSDPGRSVTESFNLLIFNEDCVTPNPVIAADRAVKNF